MLAERLNKEQDVITIALDKLPKASLEYLTGLAEGIKLARQESQIGKEEKENS